MPLRLEKLVAILPYPEHNPLNLMALQKTRMHFLCLVTIQADISLFDGICIFQPVKGCFQFTSFGAYPRRGILGL